MRTLIKWLFKLVLILVVLGAIALVGYAYLGDLSPLSSDQRIPVSLEVD
jgi:hypothetical protein